MLPRIDRLNNKHSIAAEASERKEFQHYKGFKEFSDLVKKGAAPVGAIILLEKPTRKVFPRDVEYFNETNALHKVMTEIGPLIESGNFPANTQIKLYVHNIQTEYFAKYICKALKSGKCPSNFDFQLTFYLPQSAWSEARLKQVLILPLCDVLQSGLLPDGFKIALPRIVHEDPDLQLARKKNYELVARQAVVPLVQGQRQGCNILPDAALDLICYFMISANGEYLRTPPTYPIMQQYKDKLMLISAMCFVERYTSRWTSSTLSSAFHSLFNDIVESPLSSKEKASAIRVNSPLFVSQTLSHDEFKKSRVIELGRKFGLFSSVEIIEDQENKGTFKLPSMPIKKIDELDKATSAISMHNCL